MTTGLSVATANAMLDALCRNVAFQVGAVHIKMHIGDPGAAGTANAAVNTTRQQATFGTNAANATISNTVALTWINVPGSEDYTHFSAWDDPTAGNFRFSGTVTANPVTAGNNFTLAIGDLDVSITSVAA